MSDLAVPTSARDLVLRVGYRDGAGADYLTDLDDDGFFLRSARALARGDVLAMSLSFPGLLSPVDITGVVRALSAPGDDTPDAPFGARVDFVVRDPREREVVRRLLGRFDRPPPPSAIAPLAPYRVLLVEDNRFAHKVFRHALQRFEGAGLQIIGAGDVAEGLAALEATPIDLAIVDYFLPSVSGTELIRCIRRDARWAHLPVLVISVGGLAVREETLAAGADLYLDKPVLLKQLLNTLHLLIGTP
jgi:CheY-like chemotaxis protein